MKSINDTFLKKDKLIIEPNPFYNIYNDIILKVTTDFGDQSACDFIVRPSSYEHVITDEQSDFFERLYCPSEKIQNIKETLLNQPLVETEMPELLNQKMGQNEWEIIHYCTSTEMDMVRILPIVAPIGHGKTSLIHYTLIYLRSKISYLSKTIIPIIFNFHSEKIKLELNGRNRKSINKYINSELLLEQFSRIISFDTVPSNENFWNWYLEKAGTKYQYEYNGIVDSFEYDQKKLRNKLTKLKLKERKKEKFIFRAIKYLKEVRRKEVVVVFDNIDPLDIEIIENIVWYCKRIIEHSNIKIIYTVRHVTLEELDIKTKGVIPNVRIDWTTTNSKEIITRRCKMLNNDIINRTSKKQIKINNTRVSIEDITRVMNNLTSSIVLHSEIIEVFANGNLRGQLKLLRIILRSGFLPEWVYESAILENMDFKKKKHIPSHVIVSAITTGIYSTYVEEGKYEIPGLMNILSLNTANSEVNFIYIFILQYLDKLKPKYIKTIQLVNDLSKLYSGIVSAEQVSELIIQSLSSLINNNLIHSPQKYSIEDSSFDVIKKLSICVTNLGSFYINNLLSNFNYILYVKDDTKMKKNHARGTHRIRNLVERELKFHYWQYVDYNLRDLIKFLRAFGLVEMQLLKEFKENGQLEYYFNYFSSSRSKFIAIDILQQLIEDFKDVNSLNKVVNKIRTCQINGINKLQSENFLI